MRVHNEPGLKGLASALGADVGSQLQLAKFSAKTGLRHA